MNKNIALPTNQESLEKAKIYISKQLKEKYQNAKIEHEKEKEIENEQKKYEENRRQYEMLKELYLLKIISTNPKNNEELKKYLNNLSEDEKEKVINLLKYFIEIDKKQILNAKTTHSVNNILAEEMKNHLNQIQKAFDNKKQSKIVILNNMLKNNSIDDIKIDYLVKKIKENDVNKNFIEKQMKKIKDSIDIFEKTKKNNILKLEKENKKIHLNYKVNFSHEYSKVKEGKNNECNKDKYICFDKSNNLYNFYKILNTLYNSSNNNKELKNSGNIKNIINSFNDNIKLYKKIKNSNPPITNKEFLNGLNRNESVTKEDFSLGVKRRLFPISEAIILDGVSLTSGQFFTGMRSFLGKIAETSLSVGIASIFITHYILELYRREKRLFSQNIHFLAKYMPNQGFRCFKSAIFTNYHKIFYYNTSNNIDINIKINKYYKFILGNDNDDFEEKFINKVLFSGLYLKSYKKVLFDKFNKSDESNKDNFSKINKDEEFTKLLEAFSKGGSDLVNSYDEIGINNNKKTHIKNIVEKYTKVQKGGDLKYYKNTKNFDSNNNLENNKTAVNNINILHSTNFKLNYPIGENHLLTSGNINYNNLFKELSTILYSQSTAGNGGIIKISTFSMDFFCNGSLYYELEEIGKKSKLDLNLFTRSFINKDNTTHDKILTDSNYNRLLSYRFMIVNFLQEYLISFISLYLLSREAISILIKNEDKLRNNIIDEQKEIKKLKKEYDIFIKELDSMNHEINRLKILRKYNSTLKELEKVRKDAERLRKEFFSSTKSEAEINFEKRIKKFKNKIDPEIKEIQIRININIPIKKKEIDIKKREIQYQYDKINKKIKIFEDTYVPLAGMYKNHKLNFITSYTTNPFKGEKDYFEDNKAKIVYYTLLMKYCYLAIDHLLKKLKIIIINDEGKEKYSKNLETEKKIEEDFKKYCTETLWHEAKKNEYEEIVENTFHKKSPNKNIRMPTISANETKKRISQNRVSSSNFIEGNIVSSVIDKNKNKKTYTVIGKTSMGRLKLKRLSNQKNVTGATGWNPKNFVLEEREEKIPNNNQIIIPGEINSEKPVNKKWTEKFLEKYPVKARVMYETKSGDTKQKRVAISDKNNKIKLTPNIENPSNLGAIYIGENNAKRVYQV